MGNYCFMGMDSVWVGGKVLEMGGDDGYTMAY